MRVNILLNTTEISQSSANIFEFILSTPTFVLSECYHVKNAGTSSFYQINPPFLSLQGHLFEINHLRIDPLIHPSEILPLLKQHLKGFGLSIPHEEENVRSCWTWPETFKLRMTINNYGDLLFMSPTHPSLKIKHK